MGIDPPLRVLGLEVVFADWLYCRTRTKILVLNVLGGKMMIYAGWPSRYTRGNKWEWNSKYVTKDCAVCPYCVSRDDVIDIVKGLIRSKDKRRKWIPPGEDSVMGLCVWGVCSKFLSLRGKNPRSCEYIKKPSPRNR